MTSHNNPSEDAESKSGLAPTWTVESALSALPRKPQTDSNSPLPFFHLLSRLKTTKREGWRRFNILQGESISDHMHRMAIISMCAPASLRAKLNFERCVALSLVHDMAELLVGDITPVDNVPKSEKHRRETLTMEYLCRDVLGKFDRGEAGERISNAWQEYEDEMTPESRFVHDVDKLELILQLFEYEQDGQGETDLSEFVRVASRIKTAEVKEWASDLLAERDGFWNDIKNKKPVSDNR